ncbi:cyclic nucleotide-gated ion channel 1-like, partial [Pyrus ussuriensis x Pyrus communis]
LHLQRENNILDSFCAYETFEVKAESLSSYIVRISFVAAVVMDPFFYYIPIIDQDNKCLGMDKKLWTGSLIFRSLLDFIALVHLLYRLVLFKEDRGYRPQVFTSVSIDVVTSVSIDVFALLPIPQLIMGVAFYKIWGSGSIRQLKWSGWYLLGQSLLRICRIRQELERIKNIGILRKATAYFGFYILLSHVLGALWYFLSIDREISCWHSACVNHNTYPKRCIDAFYCDRPTIASRNITFLNEHCSINISDGDSSVPFNFGIFLDALNTDIVGHVNLLRKFIYCFWWGLRNVSNFGTNLMTSTYEAENLFAICISVYSFLLLTLIAATAGAPLQAPVSEQRRRKILMENLKSWNISGPDLPVDLAKEIWSSIDKKVEENEDADLKNDIFSILPAETREPLQRFLCMEILRTVPVLEMMGRKALGKICDYLKPATYKESSFIFRIGDPLDCMLFIIKGTVWTYSRTSSTSATSSKMAARLLGKGQFYGEELLNSPDFTKLPISTEHVKTRGKVQAFALMADDLATVVANNRANNDDIVEIN